jgi:methylated-DNA-[protein]-cysteine S-methyltransferase
MKQAYFYETQIGRIGIAEENGFVTNVFFGGTVRPKEFEEHETAGIKRAATQIKEYLQGKRREFDLPVLPEGTEFEKMVWNELLKIPYGETRTYRELAKRIGKPNACRAVGRANGRNPISILIPCHRVIGADGTLTGYAGGLEMKKILLQIENSETCRDLSKTV